MRTIGVVTTSRADYAAYRPVMRAIQGDPELRLLLYVSGTHLSPQHGLTIREIEADGFEISQQIDVPLISDSPTGISESMGQALASFARALAQTRPDILLIEGDRFEMLAFALAAVPFNIPMAHMGGGDVTIGAIDDALRHALTKLSHLHFPSTEEYARRIMQMGEDPWRITVSGEPSLDAFASMKLFGREELKAAHSLSLPESFLIVTYHPVTLQPSEGEWQIEQLLEALTMVNHPAIFTMPNADAGNQQIRKRIRQFAAANSSKVCLVENLGVAAYASLMALADAMVGNSSSGIIEAASFKLPVVNVGIRQAGRVRAKNVIDVGNSKEEIVAGIVRAVAPDFRTSLNDLKNPYATGCAIDRIVRILKEVKIDARLLQKRFSDLPVAGRNAVGR